MVSLQTLSLVGVCTNLLLYCKVVLVDCSSGIVTDRNLLRSLLTSEMEVAKLLRAYVVLERHKIDLIETYLNDYEDVFKSNEEDVKTYLDHPLQSYLAIKHFTKDWEDVMKFINLQMTKAEELMKNISETRRNYEPETVDDMYENASNLLRLQITYNLSIPALASGHIVANSHDLGRVSTSKFDGYNCLVMGLVTAHEGYKQLALDWLDLAEYQIKSGDTSANQYYIDAERENVAKMKKKAIKANFTKDHARFLTEEELQTKYETNKDETGYAGQVLEDELYMRLCRGLTFSPEGRSRDRPRLLRCSFYGKDPWLRLQPLKMEIIFDDPRIMMIHDFLRIAEIDAFTGTNRSNEMQISLVTDKQDDYVGQVDIASRTSLNFWVSDYDSADIRRVSRKITAAIGLDASDMNGNSEMYQIANYPIGGRYLSHFDYFNDNTRHVDAQGCGDRLLTFMMYLNDVPEGGATVFTDLKISVVPEKGSALVWWNLDRKGEGDNRTYHGGCPVLYGTKWIANKWICFNSATFVRPCGMSPDEYNH